MNDTVKIEPLPPANHHKRLIEQLERILIEPDAEAVGLDIYEALKKLLSSAKRRELEARIEELPDITSEAEKAA